MEKVYSSIIPDKLLHFVVRKSEIAKGRTDVVGPDNFIQCSTLLLEKGKTFKPHKHIWKRRKQDVIAQESWIVVQGRVKCLFFDVDDKWLKNIILEPGDASFTLEGGHTYEILEENTLVFEYKTGPYEGIKNDKIHIEDIRK